MTVDNVPSRAGRIGFRLDPADKAALHEIARRRGCELSDLVREALLAYFSLPSAGEQTTTTVVTGTEQNGRD
jgi:hypothetical protein